MSSAPPSLAPQVQFHELVLLVNGFLKKHSATFPKAFSTFFEESRAFRDGVRPAGRVKDLDTVMNEFLELAHAQQVRRAFVSSHASAILEPRVHATLGSIADLLDDYRLLRESPKLPAAADFFDGLDDFGRDSPSYDNVQGVPILQPAPSSPSSSVDSSSRSTSSQLQSNLNVGTPSRETGRKRKKKKPPRRRQLTGTSVVLGKRTLDDIDPVSDLSQSGVPGIQGFSSNDKYSLGSNNMTGPAGGNLMHMPLNNIDVRSFVEDPNLPDMLASQINRMAKTSHTESQSKRHSQHNISANHSPGRINSSQGQQVSSFGEPSHDKLASPTSSASRRKRVRTDGKSSMLSVISALNHDPKFANIVASSAVGSRASPARRQMEVPVQDQCLQQPNNGNDSKVPPQNNVTRVPSEQVPDNEIESSDNGDRRNSGSNAESAKQLLDSADLEGLLAKVHGDNLSQTRDGKQEENSFSDSDSDAGPSDSDVAVRASGLDHGE